MLKPLTLMAHVLILFTLTVQAQSIYSNTYTLCVIAANTGTQKVNLSLTQQQPRTIACNYEDADVSVPKFLQFSCEGGSSTVTAQVVVTDGKQTQTISKDFTVNEYNAYHEMPLLAHVSDNLLKSGNASIKSVTFINNMNTTLTIGEIAFAKMSTRYEVKMNQVFSVEVGSSLNRKHVIQSATDKDVFINMYKSNGAFDHKIVKSLKTGENPLSFEEMQVKPGKYVVVITDAIEKKNANTKIIVMQ